MADTPTKDETDLMRYQNEQVKRFRKNLDKALSGKDADAVHDLRVASRRLAGVLELMIRCVGGKRAARMQRSLKRVRRAFRKVRDLDVLLALLGDEAGNGPLDPAVRAEVEAVLNRRRERAAAAATSVAQKPGLARRFASLDELRDAFARLAKTDPALVDDQLWGMLKERAAALLQEQPGDDQTDLHRVRIRVKRVRYCAELLKECGCLEADELMETLGRMQAHLGHWNDQVMATRRLSRLAGRFKFASRWTDSSAKLLEYAARRARAAVEMRQQVLELWPSLVAALKASVPGLDGDQTSSAETEMSNPSPQSA